MKTPQEVFKEVLKDLGFYNYKQSEMSNSDNWMCTVEAMERYASQFEPKWISINELPEENERVLLHASGNRMFTAIFNDGVFSCYNPFYDEPDEPEYVTHWMPLPEPPKQ